MNLKLTHKTLLPIVVVGVIVLIVFAYLQWVDAKHDENVARHNDVLAVRESTQRLASEVKSGILTRDDSYAVAAAKTAADADEVLMRLAAQGELQTDLARSYQDYVAAVVGIGSVFLENRQAEGQARMAALSESERRIGEAIRNEIARVEAETRSREQTAKLFKLLAATTIAGIVAAMVLV